MLICSSFDQRMEADICTTVVERVDLLDVQPAQIFPLTYVHSLVGYDGWISIFAKIRPLNQDRQVGSPVETAEVQ